MKLTRREKQLLFERLTPVIKGIICDLYKTKYTNAEIAERSKLPASRISELANSRRTVNEKDLFYLTGGGIIRMEQVIRSQGADISDDERDYLRTFTVLETRNIMSRLEQAVELGIDIERVLDEAIAAKKE